MGNSASRACALLALAAAPASAKLIPIEKSESYAPVLREIQDIKDYLHTYLFDKDRDTFVQLFV